MSGGHLCEAEAPTEPAGDDVNGCGNPFFLLEYYGFFSRYALRMTDIQLLQAPQGVQIYFRLNKILPFIIALSGILP